ncbi:hypothetical protein ASD62_18750 [Phycicoccus sp. Root563]|uniref:rod shape-determining protein MreC n=1 Tax=Phycicoccus sp. Root563 TaxID=1736562 RepID=UPI000702B9EE|nr:rod shape-determining protein MreC [Phycicoccus sp. Root563]KQZ87592.1 hypothetical protein ASD62_18750 [Phycicoccus sp. Root563]
MPRPRRSPRTAARPLRSDRSRRLLTTLLLATIVVLVADLAGAPGTGAVRTAAGVVLGPVEGLLRPEVGRDDPGVRGTRAATAADTVAAQATEAAAFQRLLRAPETRGRAFVPARVVAVGRAGSAGPERVTIDAGSRDGVRIDRAVVNADGLVGRVVAVSPWTADVQLVGAADLTISVRAGAGVLGSVGSGATGPRRQAPGELTLTPVQRGTLSHGDVVTTLGSLDGTPYLPGLRVGTVTEVDGDPAALVPTAGVRPAVDVTTLDVVGVLVPAGRTVPRAPSTGGG